MGWPQKLKKIQDFQLEEGRDFIQKINNSGRNLIWRPRILFQNFLMKWLKKKIYKNFYLKNRRLKKIKGKRWKLFYIIGLLLRKADNSSKIFTLTVTLANGNLNANPIGHLKDKRTKWLQKCSYFFPYVMGQMTSIRFIEKHFIYWPNGIFLLHKK